MSTKEGLPRQSLSAIDVIALIVGLVIGAGIFKTPAVVAANSGSETAMMLSWLLGGLISVVGALCYAELAAAYPHAGGEYHFLHKAYGRTVSFLFGWSRMVVLQTGSIALLAFVLADYVSQLLPSPVLSDGASRYLSGWLASGVVMMLTALNMVGLQSSKLLQKLLTVITLAGLMVISIVALLGPWAGAEVTAPGTADSGETAFGLAMVFVLLTYGGWNEAAYVSAELHQVRRNMWKVLIVGLGIVTVIYLLINLAYLKVLGLQPMAQSDAVTADLVRQTFGEGAAILVTALIVVAILASLNVTILTGARTNYAMGRDVPLFGFLGHWASGPNAPVTALLVQGLITVILIAVGATGRSGFETMVSYVSPVFWLFFLMTTLSLIVLRHRDPARPRPFRVPGYPLTPLLFAMVCGYMFYASLVYSGLGALVGVVMLIAGIPVAFMRRARSSGHPL